MAPLPWVRRIADIVPELNTIPLFGNAPAFDWSHFSSLIGKNFGVSGISIHAKEQDWKEHSEIRKGLGGDLLAIPILVTPLGLAVWAMSYDDVAKLASWVMKPQAKTRTLSSEILQEGFYRYLLLQALSAVQEMAPFKNLSLHISEEEVPLETAFCVDVEIRLDHKRSCWGRLVIPKEMRGAWVKHFSHMPSEYVSTELAKSLPIAVGLSAGSVTLQREEWKKIKAGDFVVLDHGSYNPKERAGTAQLMLQSTPLFNVHLGHGKAELAGYAFYDEDKMSKKHDLESADSEPRALKELPLVVTVEIARLKMTLDQLVHLAPGNKLELPVGSDDAVSLVVNGEKVGRAELVYLGEKLGLRILEI